MARICAVALPRSVSRRVSSAIEAPPSALGRTIPSGWLARTAARSLSASSPPSGLIRTHSLTVLCELRNSATCRRASGLAAAATESSRSRIKASAPQPKAFSIRSGRSPGTKRRDRSLIVPPPRFSPPPPLDQRRALRGADRLVALVEHSVLECDNPRFRPRRRILERDHLRLRAQRVADEHGLRHPHLVVAEIGDERAERRIANRQPDQQRE